VIPVNVIQVLLVTTVLYFLIVAVWVLKIEDLIEQRSRGDDGERYAISSLTKQTELLEDTGPLSDAYREPKPQA
jgi:hypothetical protein